MSQLSSDFDNDKALKARRGDFRCIIIMCVCGGVGGLVAILHSQMIMCLIN